MIKYLCSGDIIIGYFNTRKMFLTPSFELNVEEEAKLLKFLLFLENSNVSSIINKYIESNKRKGGRPNVNYYNLFATIIYGFTFGRDTLRDLEDTCLYDLRYIFLMEQTKVSYSTFSHFIKKVIVPNEKEIFSLLNLQIKKELNIYFDDANIDGTKFEANANKYKFVWKPITFHKKNTIFIYVLELKSIKDLDKLVKVISNINITTCII